MSLYSPWLWKTWPNRLSFLRIILSFPIAGLTIAGYPLEAGVLFAVAQLTDFADGELAKRPGQRTEYGARKLQADGNALHLVVVLLGLIVAYWSWWWLLLLIYGLAAILGDRFANSPGHRLEKVGNASQPIGYWMVIGVCSMLYLVHGAGLKPAAAPFLAFGIYIVVGIFKSDLLDNGWFNNRPFPDYYKEEYADVDTAGPHVPITERYRD